MTVQSIAMLFGGSGASNLDYFAQTFVQVQVPEASSMAMLGAAGVVLVAGRRWRRRRTV
jgi:MYXO-CTERM domain-containing protein